jgi:hypothetical protein
MDDSLNYRLDTVSNRGSTIFFVAASLGWSHRGENLFIQIAGLAEAFLHLQQ